MAIYRDFGLRLAIRKIWKVGLFIVWQRIVGRRTPRAVYVRRLLACRRCAMFHLPRFSCGWPGLRDSDGNQMGCLCDLRFKASYLAAGCWLDEIEGEPLRWNSDANAITVRR